MAKRLLPCPFCGAPARRVNHRSNWNKKRRGPWSVECSRDCRAVLYDDKDKAGRLWNVRVVQLKKS